MSSELDHFGDFLMKNLRDRAVSKFDRLAKGQSNAPRLQALQQALSGFSDEQIEIIRAAMLKAVDSGVHDFLFALQEECDFDSRIQLVVDGKNIAHISDGLHGELFTEDGWQARFSEFGEDAD